MSVCSTCVCVCACNGGTHSHESLSLSLSLSGCRCDFLFLFLHSQAKHNHCTNCDESSKHTHKHTPTHKRSPFERDKVFSECIVHDSDIVDYVYLGEHVHNVRPCPHTPTPSHTHTTICRGRHTRRALFPLSCRKVICVCVCLCVRECVCVRVCVWVEVCQRHVLFAVVHEFARLILLLSLPLFPLSLLLLLCV